MEFLVVLLTSVLSVVVLFALTKLMGNKQISQLNMFDYITGITIGSIAAEMAVNLDETFFYSFEAMIIYGILAVIITKISAKKIGARKFLVGYPILLYDNGVFYRENFKRSKIDISDFLTLCRSQGYFNLNQIQTAIIEYNGMISFLPSAKFSPPTADDLNLSPKQENLLASVIFDGHIIYDSLKSIGRNEKWLENQISAQGYKSKDEIYLGLCDRDGNLALYPINNEKKTLKILE